MREKNRRPEACRPTPSNSGEPNHSSDARLSNRPRRRRPDVKYLTLPALLLTLTLTAGAQEAAQFFRVCWQQGRFVPERQHWGANRKSPFVAKNISANQSRRTRPLASDPYAAIVLQYITKPI